jgi:hypothetical protein
MVHVSDLVLRAAFDAWVSTSGRIQGPAPEQTMVSPAAEGCFRRYFAVLGGNHQRDRFATLKQTSGQDTQASDSDR